MWCGVCCYVCMWCGDVCSVVGVCSMVGICGMVGVCGVVRVAMCVCGVAYVCSVVDEVSQALSKPVYLSSDRLSLSVCTHIVNSVV